MTAITFDLQILWPVMIVVFLTVLSGIRLVTLRISAMKSGNMRISFYRSYRGAEEPEMLAVATRHYANLFETPILFYLGCIVAGLLGPASLVTLIAAWGFAGLRITQSLIHLTSNNVKARAYAFFSSCLMLVTLWGANIIALIGNTA